MLKQLIELCLNFAFFRIYGLTIPLAKTFCYFYHLLFFQSYNEKVNIKEFLTHSIKTLRFTAKRFLIAVNSLFWSKGLSHHNSNDLVSIIMPTYNRKHEIDKAIGSVIKQSYSYWELIIIDDGSNDNTIEYLKSKYKNLIETGKIKLISGAHLGVSHARNLGLENATGKWIAYLDTDNSWRSNFLSTHLSNLSFSGSQCSYCAVLVKDYEIYYTHILFIPQFDWKSLLHANYIDLNSFIHSRQLYTQLGGFDTELKRLVDWDLILRYTHESPALPIKALLVDYYIKKKSGGYSITTHESFHENEEIIKRKWLQQV